MYATKVVNLAGLLEYQFIIPTFQRPYVWGEEELKKLLDDFHKAFSASPESRYYIGTILTREQQPTEHAAGCASWKAELIDGQQRFTTLWLASLMIAKRAPRSRISRFLLQEDNLRIGFEIRQEVAGFLSNLIREDNQDNTTYDENFIESHPYLRNIVRATTFIQSYIDQLGHAQDELEVEKYGNYIFENVVLIKNSTPPNTDLNKLFATINSAGMQLEQTDIVKSNLLKKLQNKVLHGKIWEACENMDNFFEQNVRSLFPHSDFDRIGVDQFADFDEELFRYEDSGNENSQEHEGFSIRDFDMRKLATYSGSDTRAENEEDRESQEVYCRSIISFGQLLLHTCRIHLLSEGRPDFHQDFHVNRLVEVFGELEAMAPEEIHRFFIRLWNTRYLFDRYVIKWVADNDTKTESLELMNLSRKDGYFSREKMSPHASMMLQSVLYFTGDYLRQYWLTPYLHFLHGNQVGSRPNDASLLKYLESVDNEFSSRDGISNRRMSWNLMAPSLPAAHELELREYLTSSLGTGFRHYWFYKLEYLLWKHWPEKTGDERFARYRIKSKNSIEHISPQTPVPQSSSQGAGAHLHSFGNLVLLSVSQNSEYSNKSVRIKRSMFDDKRDTYDSLKSYHIFRYTEWGPAEIDDHLHKMINLLERHYGLC